MKSASISLNPSKVILILFLVFGLGIVACKKKKIIQEYTVKLHAQTSEKSRLTSIYLYKNSLIFKRYDSSYTKAKFFTWDTSFLAKTDDRIYLSSIAMRSKTLADSVTMKITYGETERSISSDTADYQPIDIVLP